MKRIVCITLICLGLFLIGVVGGYTIAAIRDRAPDPVEPCEFGEITILEPDGELYLDYKGAINILNDGADGENIDIMVELTDTGVCDYFIYFGGW